MPRTIEQARKELLLFYKQRDQKPFSATELMAKNSGLERYFRLYHDGLYPFCEKEGLLDLLKPKKRIPWTKERMIAELKRLYEKRGEPLYATVLAEENNSLYQKLKNEKTIKKFLKENNLDYLWQSKKEAWDEAKCFRLIKEMFVEKQAPVNPENIKKSQKGAYNFMFEKYGSVERFASAFDLHEYIQVERIAYTDEEVIRLIKEAYVLNDKQPVHRNWLRSNQFGALDKYIAAKANNNFIKGAAQLGLEKFVVSKSINWSDELAIKRIVEIAQDKGEPVISSDFERYRLTGLRDWITKNHGGLEPFFKTFDLLHLYENKAKTGFELWNYGLRFQVLAKEILELFFENIIYDRSITGSRKRPDFQIGKTGLWLDSKLSNIAYFSEKEQIEAYTSHKECEELWLFCLDAIDNGREFPIGNPKVKILFVHEYYDDLRAMKREDLIERTETLRKEVEEVRKTSSTKKSRKKKAKEN